MSEAKAEMYVGNLEKALFELVRQAVRAEISNFRGVTKKIDY